MMSTGKYIPPHLRPRPPAEATIIEGPTLITEGGRVIQENILAAVDGSDSYTYCTWITLHQREVGAWCSLIHRGNGEFVRCPGIWLHNLSNQLHVRIDTNQRTNVGIFYSSSELPLNQNVHIAVVANSSTGDLQLYLNGHLDYTKHIDGQGERFALGRDCLFLGQDPWHGSSQCTFMDTCVFNTALNAQQISDVVMRLDGLTELPIALPRLEIPDATQR